MKKLLAITLTLAMLVGLLAVTGVSTSAASFKSGSIKGQYQALPRYADISNLGTSLIKGMMPSVNSSFSYAVDNNEKNTTSDKFASTYNASCVDAATDGVVGSKETKSRFVYKASSVTLYFDIGYTANITDFVIAASQCDTLDYAVTAKTAIYVGDNATSLVSDANRVWEHAYADITTLKAESAYALHIQPADGATVTGRYIAFVIKDPTDGTNFTEKWWGQLRIGEVAAYGKAVAGTGYSAVSLTSADQLPTAEALTTGLALGRWDTINGIILPGGGNSNNGAIKHNKVFVAPNTYADKFRAAGKYTAVTDGEVVFGNGGFTETTSATNSSGVANIPIPYAEGKYWETFSVSGTKYTAAYESRSKVWRAYDADDSEYTYLDLGARADITQILLGTYRTSSRDLVYDSAAAADGRPTSADHLNYFYSGKPGGSNQINAITVCIGDSLEDLFGQMEVTNNGSGGTTFGKDGNSKQFTFNFNSSTVALLTLDEVVTGRYIGFYIANKGHGSMVSEFAAYGNTYAKATPIKSADSADMLDCSNNVLTKGTQMGFVDGDGINLLNANNVLYDGEYLKGDNSKKLAPASSTSKYIYLTYDMETAYDFRSIMYCGDGSDGANSLGIYIGDKTNRDIIAEGLEPDYLYDRSIGISGRCEQQGDGTVALRLDMQKKMIGRYITFRFEGCRNGGANQIWVSELVAQGSPVTINTAGGQLRSVDADGNYALRFGFHMATDSIGYADAEHANGNYARAELDANSMTTIDGKAVQVVDFGAVVSNQTDITADDLTLGACSNEGTIKKVPANNLYAVKDGYITYTAVVKNIPAAAAERDLYARPYIQYMDGDQVVTIYGDMFATTVANYLK